jgi:hypothetical protein
VGFRRLHTSEVWKIKEVDLNKLLQQLSGLTPAEYFNEQLEQRELIIIELKKDYEIHCQKSDKGIQCNVFFTGHQDGNPELKGEVYYAKSYSAILKNAKEQITPKLVVQPA